MEYKVCVRCFTYNQSNYITKTMTGFAMQQTNFPFVCCIVDDASTDGEQEIISDFLDRYFDLQDRTSYEKETEYAFIRFARHKENQNCFFAVIFLKENHYRIKKPKYQYLREWQQGTPYQALCEGDDYWISKDKLQLQASFLDTHPDYSLNYCDAIIVGPNSEPLHRRKPKRYSGDCRRSLIENSNYIVTAGVCFRYKYFDEWREVRRQIPFPMKLGDKPLWIFLSTKGYFHYFDEPLVAYRLQSESASHSKDWKTKTTFKDNSLSITKYLNKLFRIGVPEKKIERDYSRGDVRIAAEYDRMLFWEQYFRHIKRFPLDIFNIRLLAIFFIRIVMNRAI